MQKHSHITTPQLKNSSPQGNTDQLTDDVDAVVVLLLAIMIMMLMLMMVLMLIWISFAFDIFCSWL